MQVELTPEANSDMVEIARFIAMDNPVRALGFVDEIEFNCQRLVDMPERFPVVLTLDGKNVRKQTYRDYVTFYRIDGDRLIVLRIVHGARVTDDFLISLA